MILICNCSGPTAPEEKKKPSQMVRMSPRVPTTPITIPSNKPLRKRPSSLTSRSERDTWSERCPESSVAQRSALGKGIPSW